MDWLQPLRLAAATALPPRCPGCGRVTAADHRFCAACWGELAFLGPPWCAACALPFEHDRGPDTLCGACLDRRPKHSGVRAAVAYGPVARSLALRLKYGGRVAFAETAGRLMARVAPAEATLLAPVPLHRWRLWRRGFNQATLLAEAVSRRTGLPVDRHSLQRRRATPPLRGLGAKGRADAVRGVFRVPPDRRERIKGQRVVLVDDVHTSGATADACAGALLRAGAASVHVLVWARVLDGSD